MKIIIGKEQIDFLKQEESKAKIGCSKCPVCKAPATSGICRTEYKRGKHMKVSIYNCSCGAQWESDPYQYAY